MPRYDDDSAEYPLVPPRPPVHPLVWKGALLGAVLTLALYAGIRAALWLVTGQ